LIGQLAPIQAGAEFALEAKRKQRLTEVLERVRRHRAGARVVLPAEELLTKLFELSKAAANDFEALRSAVERR